MAFKKFTQAEDYEVVPVKEYPPDPHTDEAVRVKEILDDPKRVLQQHEHDAANAPTFVQPAPSER